MKSAIVALSLLLGSQSAPAQSRIVVAGPPPVPSDSVEPSASLVVSPGGPIAPGSRVVLDATASAGDDFAFDTDVDESLYQVDTGGRILYFWPPGPGVYRFKVESFGLAGGKVKVARAKAVVTVGSPPGPTPIPVPPTPDPGPTPGTWPVPPPSLAVVAGRITAEATRLAGTIADPAGRKLLILDGLIRFAAGPLAIPESAIGDAEYAYLKAVAAVAAGSVPPAPPKPDVIGNMRVVLLYESSDPMTPAQRATIFSTTKVIPYLESHCLKGTDGRAGWRFWDKDVNVTNEPAEWQDAMAKAKADPAPLPKLVVFAGNTVAAAKPVTNESDSLAFLSSLGGP